MGPLLFITYHRDLFYNIYNLDIGKISLTSANRVIFLSIYIDEWLKLHYHALTRICKYMDKKKWRAHIKVFGTSHFSYCPLTWMLHSRNIEHRITKIGGRALKLVYNDTPNLSFDELLVKDKSVSVHQRNFQLPAFKFSKVKMKLLLK